MHLQPLCDRVIIKRREEAHMTAGGIVIPDAAAEKPNQGDVIAVGSGKLLPDGRLLPLDVQVGERGMFGKYAGQAVKIDNEEFLVMREDDIMAIIEDRGAAMKNAA